jgi:hypothetical protein
LQPLANTFFSNEYRRHMTTPQQSTSDALLQTLEEKAKRLASSNCPYMAGVILAYYDGEQAEETKDARIAAAKKYFDLSNNG